MVHIRPPLALGVTKEVGGLRMEQEIREGETLGEVLARMAAQTPEAFRGFYIPEGGGIKPLVVTAVNGTILPGASVMETRLADGDQITWFLVYAGG